MEEKNDLDDVLSTSVDANTLLRSVKEERVNMNGYSQVEDLDLSKNLNEALTSTADAKREVLLLKAQLREANGKIQSLCKVKDKKGIEQALEENFGNISDVEKIDDDQRKEEKFNDVKGEKIETQEEEFPIIKNSNNKDDIRLESPSTIIKTDAKTIMNKDLDSYANALRKADKLEIDSLKIKLEEYRRKEKDHHVASASMSSSSDENVAERKMINVNMLDGENFSTDWDEMSPLPPPPDHSLRSPIVHTLLTQWTVDRSMQEALLSWLDGIMNGGDIESIPPLKISSLTHQVRDGFTMHVLPLLLRRSDVHVKVMTRAHRRTTYDIAVDVNGYQQKSSKEMNNDVLTQARIPASSAQMMAFHATGEMNMIEHSFESSNETNKPLTHSTGIKETVIGSTRSRMERLLRLPSDSDSNSVTHSAVTDHASNQISTPSRLMRLNRKQTSVQSSGESVSSEFFNDDDISVDSSSITTETNPRKFKSQQQSGIMAGAMSAFGGLISRRKSNNPPSQSVTDLSIVPEQDSYDDSDQSSRYYTSANMNMNTHPESVPTTDSSQPYHRVVSAPPGRIGVTFVQYRGHAVVSDLSIDSPLRGWVFSNDILIAIDEIPVSGMRMREIVKLLTSRKERQRALRMISNHATT